MEEVGGALEAVERLVDVPSSASSSDSPVCSPSTSSIRRATGVTWSGSRAPSRRVSMRPIRAIVPPATGTEACPLGPRARALMFRYCFSAIFTG